MNLDTIKNLFDNAQPCTVDLKTVITDAGTQQRAAVNKQAIEDYTANMQAGQAPNFPRIRVVRLTAPITLPDGSTAEIGAEVLVDGFQRREGALGAKLHTFQGEYVEATLEEAIYFSMCANSTNGVKMGGKDYQNAIKNLYTLDAKWRGHGMKQEIAKLLGCSTKTVQRATTAIDKATKAEAFRMFEAGYNDADVAAFAFITEKTAGEWRKEWQESKKGKDEPKGSQSGTDEDPKDSTGTNDNAGSDNPLDLTFAQVLQLKDPAIKAKLLKMLMDSIQADNQSEPEPEPQPEPEPEPEPEPSVNDDRLDELAATWSKLDCWGILGTSLAKLAKLKQPKTGLQRAYNKMLKQVHPDKYGESKALEMLKDALAQAQKEIKRL